MSKILNLNYSTTALERISYGTYFFGQNIFYFTVTMMLQIYLTNNVGIAATTVGLIFIVVKVWAAITDPILGVIIDRSNYKSGKFIPWIKLSAFLIPISTILLFVIPDDISPTMKALWAAIAYIFWGTSYTICDTPITGVSMAMTDNINERTNIISIGRLGALLAILGSSFFMPMLASKMGYSTAVIILSALAFLMMIPICYLVKERFKVRSDNNNTMKDILRYMKSNKYLLVYLLAILLGSTSMTGLTLMNYVAVYCLGGEDMQSINMLAFYAPMVASVPLVMYLSKKIDKFYLFIGSYIIASLVNLVLYLTGYENLIIYYALSIIKGICFCFSMILTYTFVADSTTYGIYKTKIHAEGISFSLQTFTQKMLFAISASLAMFIMGSEGYISGSAAEVYPKQPHKVVDIIWFIYNIFPAIGFAISAIILGFFYKLRNKDIEIMSDVNNGIITQEEAEKILPNYI